MDKDQAQSRANRIRAFQEELATLHREGVLTLPANQAAALENHHAELLRRYTTDYDIDTSHEQSQLSWGMRLASLFGALALSAAVFFFFYRFWGELTTAVQVVLLIGAPLLLTLSVALIASRDRSLYFVSLLALVAVAAFVLNLSMLGKIFNITPSPNAFLVWAAYALLLAYSYRLKLILVAGLVLLTGWLSAAVGTWSGLYWLSFGERPENFFLAGWVVFALGLFRQRAWRGFAGIYRVYGLLVMFIAVLILANWGRGSYLPFSHQLIENGYQLFGFAVSASAVWLGIRLQWPGVVNLGSTFFVLYLYTKLFDWWWDWLPKYVFFLVVGLLAVLTLMMLRKLRGRVMGAKP